MTLLIVPGIALAFVTSVCAAALVEVFRQLADLRSALNLEDEPIPLSLKGGEVTAEGIGLPSAIAREPAALVIFLSDKCATCLVIAEAFRGGSPATVWFVVPESPGASALIDMLSDSLSRVVIDKNDAVADSLALRVTPSVLTTSFGEITRAQAVSSARQVLSMLPTVFPRDLPSKAAS